MTVSGASVFSKSQEVVFRQVDSEAVFVPIRRATSDLQSIYTTNAVGTRIWELIDGARSVDEMATIITSEFDVEPAAARSDVEEFIAQLAEAGCVIGNDGSTA